MRSILCGPLSLSFYFILLLMHGRSTFNYFLKEDRKKYTAVDVYEVNKDGLTAFQNDIITANHAAVMAPEAGGDDDPFTMYLMYCSYLLEIDSVVCFFCWLHASRHIAVRL